MKRSRVGLVGDRTGRLFRRTSKEEMVDSVPAIGYAAVK